MNLRKVYLLAVLLACGVAAYGQTINPVTLPDMVRGATQQLTLVQGGQSTSWSVNPSGPFTINAGTGLLTANQGGTFTFTVTATSIGAGTATRTYTNVHVLDITTPSLPIGYRGRFYSITLAATGNVGTLTWSLATGGLPAGLSLSPQGVISGTPSANSTGSGFAIRAVDGTTGLSINGSFFITVVPDLVISSVTLPNTVVGTAYAFTFTATGGLVDGPSYTWTLTPSNLDGLTLNSGTGLLSGTTANAGDRKSVV